MIGRRALLLDIMNTGLFFDLSVCMTIYMKQRGSYPNIYLCPFFFLMVLTLFHQPKTLQFGHTKLKLTLCVVI